MLQKLPNSEHYKQIERELVSNGKPSSLSYEELKACQNNFRYTEGYKTISGTIISKAEADTLNLYITELNRTRCIATRESLKDKSHQMFCIIDKGLTGSEVLKINGKKPN